jgi:hypothetical protein
MGIWDVTTLLQTVRLFITATAVSSQLVSMARIVDIWLKLAINLLLLAAIDWET